MPVHPNPDAAPLPGAQRRPDHAVADLSQKRIKHRRVLGGLINEYERAE